MPRPVLGLALALAFLGGCGGDDEDGADKQADGPIQQAEAACGRKQRGLIRDRDTPPAKGVKALEQELRRRMTKLSANAPAKPFSCKEITELG